jgi:hypothetical protein
MTAVPYASMAWLTPAHACSVSRCQDPGSLLVSMHGVVPLLYKTTCCLPVCEAPLTITVLPINVATQGRIPLLSLLVLHLNNCITKRAQSQCGEGGYSWC